MEKKLIFSLLVFILLLQVAIAIDTQIRIKTLPEHNVTIEVLRTDYIHYRIENFEKNSGPSGEVLAILSFDEMTFDLAVWVREGNQTVLYEKFKEGYPSGVSVVLEMYPEGYILDEQTNDTSSEENSTINETLEENSTINEIEETGFKITGSTIFGDKGFLSNKTIYYGIGIIVLLLIVGFITVKTMRKKLRGPKEIKTKKLKETKAEEISQKPSEVSNKPSGGKFNTNKEIIEDAERKIKEAQEDIRKIRNEDKIKEAKKKIIEDEKELMRLREGKE